MTALRQLGGRFICRFTYPGAQKSDVIIKMMRSIRTFTSHCKMERPFRILGLQQIAVGSTSREDMLHLWVDILGMERTGQYVSAKENVDEVILTLGPDDHSVEIDLMVPLDAKKSPKV